MSMEKEESKTSRHLPDLTVFFLETGYKLYLDAVFKRALSTTEMSWLKSPIIITRSPLS